MPQAPFKENLETRENKIFYKYLKLQCILPAGSSLLHRIEVRVAVLRTAGGLLERRNLRKNDENRYRSGSMAQNVTERCGLFVFHFSTIL